jgi:hypothetical protein
MQTTENNKRRNFLKSLFRVSAGAGLVAIAGKTAKAETGEKLKLLTPDGKLVEIDRTHIEKESQERASNADVMNWMNKK